MQNKSYNGKILSLENEDRIQKFLSEMELKQSQYRDHLLTQA